MRFTSPLKKKEKEEAPTRGCKDVTLPLRFYFKILGPFCKEMPSDRMEVFHDKFFPPTSHLLQHENANATAMDGNIELRDC